MKAMVYTKIGGLDALQVRDIPRPEPKAGQVLVRARASSLNTLDYQRFKTLDGHVSPFARLVSVVQGSVGKPLGGEVAGEVVSLGRGVTSLAVGDRVFGKLPGTVPCGGWAEYAVLGEEKAARMPEGLSFEQAGVMPVSGETALGAVRRAKIAAGQQVMVYGASGGVGSFAAQFAAAAGAEVTGVCSTRNVEVAQRFGCTHVIDYKREDFRQTARRFDAIIAANGDNRVADYTRLLTPTGVFVGVGGGTAQTFGAMLAAPLNRHISFYAAPLMPVPDAFTFMAGLAGKGELTAYIDKTYPVTQAGEAIRYAVTEHLQGKVALTIDFDQA